MINQEPIKCPNCQTDDESMFEEQVRTALFIVYLCNVCSKIFSIKKQS